jgi:hypothetical protein
MTAPAPLWLACLGQQSFSVRCGADHVLIDPMLARSFGTAPALQFEIYPPRDIRVDRMPPVRAVILTNEHLDHFHLPTLTRLPSRPDIYCGSMMPRCVLEVLHGIGYRVRLLHDNEEARLGSLRLRLFRGGAESALCEQRVYNVWISRADHRDAVVFQSDALVASELQALVSSGALPRPRCVVVTDNSQRSLPGARSPWANLEVPDPAGLVAVRSAISAAEPLGATDIVLHASGYTHPHSQHGPYLWADHRWVAEQLAELCPGARVHGLDPWEAISIGPVPPVREPLSWVVPDRDRHRQLWRQHEQAWRRGSVKPPASRPLLGCFVGDDQEARARTDVATELERMSRILRVAPLLTTLSSFGGLESQREGVSIVVRLVGTNGRVTRWVYERPRRCFVERSDDRPRAAERAPFGLEAHLIDFHALTTGDLQIWEFVTCGLRDHWSPGDRTDGLLAFLFAYFGEQMRPELAAKTFAQLMQPSTEHNTGGSP